MDQKIPHQHAPTTKVDQPNTVRECNQCIGKKANGQRCTRSACATWPKCWQHLMKEDGLRIKPSGIEGAGQGLFATKKFKPGEDISYYTGDILTNKQEKHRYPTANPVYVLQSRDNKNIDARATSTHVARYANHKTLSRANAKIANIASDKWGHDEGFAKIKAQKQINGTPSDPKEIFIYYGPDYWKGRNKKIVAPAAQNSETPHSNKKRPAPEEDEQEEIPLQRKKRPAPAPAPTPAPAATKEIRLGGSKNSRKEKSDADLLSTYATSMNTLAAHWVRQNATPRSKFKGSDVELVRAVVGSVERSSGGIVDGAGILHLSSSALDNLVTPILETVRHLPEKHFLDAGSGNGVVCMYAVASGKFASAAGIEINPHAHTMAEAVRKALETVIPSLGRVTFMQGDATDIASFTAAWRRATIVYSWNSVWPAASVNRLMDAVNAIRPPFLITGSPSRASGAFEFGLDERAYEQMAEIKQGFHGGHASHKAWVYRRKSAK